MTDVNAQQLGLLRTHPQQVSLHLSIYKPNVILACKVNNASIAKGARSVAFDAVSSGSYLNIKSGMTLWLGSTPGQSDLGKVRVKSCTSDTLTVSENSDVRWSDDAEITVVDVIDIVPVFPRIIANPTDPENTIWYKDYDIVYTNQNQILGANICMGSHRAGTLDAAGQIQFYFTATGTEHVDGDTLSYDWNFPGAVGVTGSADLTPGLVTYTTPGHYMASLTVSGTNGSVDTSYRYISVYGYGDESQDWEILDGQGSRDAGGYTLGIRINKPWKYSIYDGAPVVIYGDQWNNGTYVDFGGNAQNNHRIRFVGYILQGSISWDYQKSFVEFQVGSVSEVMRSTNGFAISIEGTKVTPTTWYQIKNNTVKKSVFHFLRWHSTVLMVTDFQFLATDQYIQYYDTNRESIFDGVNSVLRSALFGELVSDSQGKLWAELSMEATHLAKTVYTPKFTLDKQDWMDEPTIQEVFKNPVSYMEMGGVVYKPYVAEDDSVALLACAPGITPSYHGKVDSPTGLALTSQTQLNQLVGDVFAYRNAKKPSIEVPLRGSYPNIDIAPLQAITVNIAAEDTSRNVQINAPYFVQSLSFSYSGENQLETKTIILREITEGFDGDTIIIPITPPVDVPPPISEIFIPPFVPIWIPLDIWTPPAEPWVSPNILAIYLKGSTDNRLWYTNELDSASPKWYAATPDTLWTAAELSGITSFKMNRWGTAYLVGRGDGIVDPANTWIYRVSVGVNDKTTIADYAYFLAQVGAGGFGGLPTIQGWGLDPINDKQIAVWVAISSPDRVSAGFYSAGTDTLTRRMVSSASYLNELGADISIYNGKIYLSAGGNDANRYLIRFNSTFTFPPEDGIVIGDATKGGIQAHALEADYNYLYPNSKLVVDDGQTIVRDTVGSITLDSNAQSLACDPTGQFVMQGTAGNGGEISYSNDYGATFTVLTSFPHHHSIVNSTIHILNLGDASKWMIAYNQSPSSAFNLVLTLDAGATWQHREGDLLNYADANAGAVGVWYA